MKSRVRLVRSLLAMLALAVALTGATGAEAAESAKPSAKKARKTATNLFVNGGFESSLEGWAGYRSTLRRTTRAAEGEHAARVSLSGANDNGFSIYPERRPVSSTKAGATYSTWAWVRSSTPGRPLCIRIREWAGDEEAGSAQACVTSTRRWHQFEPLQYRARADGHELDAYVFEWDAREGDSFDVDGMTLIRGTPPPPPPPPDGPLTATPIDHAHIRLEWPAVDGATSYRVHRGSLVLGETTETEFIDALLWPLSKYAYTVEALSGRDVISTETASAATPALPDGGFPSPFPASAVWNRPVGDQPLHPRSDGIIAYVAARVINPNMTLRAWGVAVAEAHPSDGRFDVPCVRYRNCTLDAFGTVPIPVTAQPDPETDGHLTIHDPAAARAWDMWQASPGGGWTAGAGAGLSLEGDGIAPPGTASGNAANFPLLGGLVRPEELLQGRIEHALVFGMPGVNKTGAVCPANHHDGSSRDPNSPMEGQWLRLDPRVDVGALRIPAWQKTIARAVQEYGMYLRDSSGSFAIWAENPIARGYDAWAAAGLPGGGSASLAGIPWDRLQVLQPPC